MTLVTPEELAHDRLLYIKFYDHYSQQEDVLEGIQSCLLEAIGWFIEEDDIYIKVAWLRDYFKNEMETIDGERCMFVVKSTIVEQKEINMV